MTTLPKNGQRCPRCHQRAPRMDGIQCKLCAPEGRLTFTDPRTGIVHKYRTGCNSNVALAGLNVSWMNIGDVPVTCLLCIGTAEERKVQGTVRVAW